MRAKRHAPGALSSERPLEVATVMKPLVPVLLALALALPSCYSNGDQAGDSRLRNGPRESSNQ